MNALFGFYFGTFYTMLVENGNLGKSKKDNLGWVLRLSFHTSLI